MPWWNKEQLQIISAPFAIGTPELDLVKNEFKTKLDIKNIDEVQKTPTSTYLLMTIKSSWW